MGILAFIASFILFFYKLPQSFYFNPDFARDLYFISNIVSGKLTLIGPKLTFGGLYTGPFYFYLFAPFYFLSGKAINSLLVFNALLFAVAIGYFAYKCNTQFSRWRTIVATAALALSPLLIITSRSPSNAFTYVAILIALFTYLYFNTVKSIKELITVGFICGMLANFHPVTMSVTPFIFLYVFLFLKKRWDIVYSVLGFFIAFVPLVLFELKHNFVIFKNTFIDKSYLKWVNSENIPGGLSGKKNVFENIAFLSDQMKPLLAIHPGILFFVTAVLNMLHKYKLSSREGLFFVGSIMSMMIVAIVLRSQFIPHYLFATATLLLFTTILFLLKSRYAVILIALIVLEVFAFPAGLYMPSGRTSEQYRRATEYVLSHSLLEKGTNFNIIQVTVPDMLAPIAFEYRYFFKEKGYLPTSEFAYNQSDVLFIFSEVPDLNITKMDTWEVQQFGKEHFTKAKKYTSGNITIFRIEK
jgi:hypothetical protein